jgi:hypothetical protein
MVMKEKPILFSTPMVQALLNTKLGVWPAKPIDPGKPFKWITRHVVKPQPDCDGIWNYTEFPMSIDSDLRGWWGTTDDTGEDHHYSLSEKGDILWVRETWRCTALGSAGDTNTVFCAYRAGGQRYFDVDMKQAIYFADKGRWRPPIYMPRKVARLFLEVKDVRVERLQDITEEDVRAEGWPEFYIWCGQRMEYVGPYYDSCPHSVQEHQGRRPAFCYDRSCYSASWNKLNARRGYSWEDNPWVWVIEFRRIEK